MDENTIRRSLFSLGIPRLRITQLLDNHAAELPDILAKPFMEARGEVLQLLQDIPKDDDKAVIAELENDAGQTETETDVET